MSDKLRWAGVLLLCGGLVSCGEAEAAQGKRVEAAPRPPSPVYMKGYRTAIDTANGVVCYEWQVRYTAHESVLGSDGERVPTVGIALALSCVKVR